MADHDSTAVRDPEVGQDPVTGRGPAALTVRDLRFSFGTRVAVDDVDFDVAPGEVVGLLGPNGAGKTTNEVTLSCR